MSCYASHGPIAEGVRDVLPLGGVAYFYLKGRLERWGQVFIRFSTASPMSARTVLAPRITINVTLPDDQTFEKSFDTQPQLFNASKSVSTFIMARPCVSWRCVHPGIQDRRRCLLPRLLLAIVKAIG